MQLILPVERTTSLNTHPTPLPYTRAVAQCCLERLPTLQSRQQPSIIADGSTAKVPPSFNQCSCICRSTHTHACALQHAAWCDDGAVVPAASCNARSTRYCPAICGHATSCTACSQLYCLQPTVPPSSWVPHLYRTWCCNATCCQLHTQKTPLAAVPKCLQLSQYCRRGVYMHRLCSLQRRTASCTPTCNPTCAQHSTNYTCGTA
jgi:hypothetical protein